MSTTLAKKETLQRKWYVIDAAGKPLGRTAVEAAIFFFQAEDGIRAWSVTGVQTCALPISGNGHPRRSYSFPARYFAPYRPGRSGRASCRERV